MTRTLTTSGSTGRLAIAFIVILLAAVPVAGTGEKPASSSAGARAATAAESWLDQRVDIELEDARAAEFFRSMAEISELEVAEIPELDGSLSMELHGVRVATALTAACESVGCVWRVEDGRLRILRDTEAPVRKPEPAGAGRTAGGSTARERATGPLVPALDEPIDIELRDADLRQVLRSFGEASGAAVRVDDALQGSVTVQLHSVPIRQALDALCGIEGCEWDWLETDEGPVLVFEAE